jgi:hypothetical protein
MGLLSFPLPPQYEPKIGRLGSIAGLIPVERLPGFERLLFRATRGNNYFRSMPVGLVADPASGEPPAAPGRGAVRLSLIWEAGGSGDGESERSVGTRERRTMGTHSVPARP